MEDKLALPAKGIEAVIVEITGELATAQADIDKITQTAQSLAVNSPEGEASATELIIYAKMLGKDLEEKRLATAGVLDKWATTINKLCKTPKDQITSAIMLAGKKLADYKQKLEEIRQAELKVLAKAIAEEDARLAKERETEIKSYIVEKAVSDALGTKPPDPSFMQTEAKNIFRPEVVEKKTSVHSGSASVKTIAKFEIINVGLIPRQFWVVDEKLIAAQVRAGVETIPGVRIWKEAVLGRVNLKK